MTRRGDLGSAVRGVNPRDANAMAVILLAVILAAGTALPQLGQDAPGFSLARDAAVSLPAAGVERSPTLRAQALSTRAAPGAPGRAPQGTARRGKPPLVGALDPNTADAEALQALPGLGLTLARRIVAYREAHGQFRTPEDLLQVPGIGPKRWERIRPLLRAPGAAEAP